MKKYSIALDVGATKTLGGLILGQKTIKTIKGPTYSKQPNKKIIKTLKKTINELWVPGVKQIGIGIAGQVDHKTGLIHSSTNFQNNFKNIKLSEILQKEFKVPVKLDNDVNCFTKAEIKYGWGKIFKNFVGLTFGTGIGGGICINNSIHHGLENMAGEVGMMKIAGTWIGTPPTSPHNQKYCWESLASGSAWNKLAKKYGEKKADQIIITNIATGLVNLATSLAPEAFVLGGGLTEHSGICNKIKKEFDKQATHPLLKKTRITKSKLDGNAILMGSLLENTK